MGLGQQASFCPLTAFGFLLWMVFWNRPGCICYPIQKVSINVIHLQINFSASGWVSNKKKPPCGAQPGLTCSPGDLLPLTLGLGVVSPDNAPASVWRQKQPLRHEEWAAGKQTVPRRGASREQRIFQSSPFGRSCWQGL